MGYNILRTVREFYFNGDFDWTLRGKVSRLEGNGHTFIHEMANHFLFAADSGDSMVLHAPLPDDFLAYLSVQRLAPPGVMVHPAFTASAAFSPFGWNPHTQGLNRRYAIPASHPSLDVVRQANGRSFSHALEKKTADRESDLGGMFDSLAGLKTHMRENPSPSGWVAKAEHGHAGTANRRIPASGPGELEDRELDRLLAENGRVALEPWHERLLDLAVNFEVLADGSISRLRGHALLNSRDGAFLGVKVTPDGQPPDPWKPALAEAAALTGRALHAIGYFGPVSQDAYVRRSPSGPALRPCVDVNARLSMALPAHGLARRLPDRHVLWTWARPKKLVLPESYADLARRLGPSAFEPDTRTGILAVSPLRLGPPGAARRLPRRVGFALCARDEAELARWREDFRRRLERP